VKPIPGLLTGEVAIITGGAHGIGRAIARTLAASGAAVAIGDRDAGGAAAVAAELATTGARSYAGSLDVRSPDSCSAFVEAVATLFGRMSILVNNAGVLHGLAIDDPGFAASWDACFAANVNGTVNMTTAALPALRHARGCILNLCSTSAFLSSNRGAAYASSKAAIAALTRSLAVELGGDGIRVNALAPGIVNTGIAGSAPLPAALAEQYRLRTPLSRVAEPEDIAGPALFLVSALATHITGAILPVDGGYLASGTIVA